MNPHQNFVTPTRRGREYNAELVTLLLAVVIATLAVAPAYAQSRDTVKATIPFTFRAGDLQVPAGKYTIERASSWSMILRNARGEGRLLAMTSLLVQATDQPLQPRLVFHRYGSQYFLAEIWTPQWGQKLPPSSAEREAMRSHTPTPIAVAATPSR